MKLRGQRPGVATSPIVFERPTGPIVFLVSAVMNTSDFDKIYPEPTPPTRIIKGGIRVKNTDSPVYKDALALRNRAYTAWLVIQSLSSTEGLEWELVKMDDPNTWTSWQDDMKQGGLSDGECIYILKKVIEVNALDEVRLDEARNSFLLGRAEEASNESSSPATEQTNT